MFLKLAPGRYRIVEIIAAEDYDLNRIEFEVSNEFIITGSETESVKITVLNYKTNLTDQDDQDNQDSDNPGQNQDQKELISNQPGSDTTGTGNTGSEAPKTGSGNGILSSFCLMLLSSVCWFCLIRRKQQKQIQ